MELDKEAMEIINMKNADKGSTTMDIFSRGKDVARSKNKDFWAISNNPDKIIPSPDPKIAKLLLITFAALPLP